ncbi:MAG: MinD/ParA family protein [Holosporales bacterium]
MTENQIMKEGPHQRVTQPHHGKGMIYLIASGKGGVGKTWISTNIAHALARENHKVLLFDGDLGMANVDIQLGLTPDKDLGGYIQGSMALRDVVIPYADGHYHIIAGRSGSGSLATLSPQRLALMKEDLKHISRGYDYTLIDLGAGVGGTVRALSSLASRCYVVVTDEPTSLTDAYAFIKVTRGLYPEMQIHVLINQAENATGGKTTFATLENVCQNFLKYQPQLAGVIRRDTKVKDAIRHQELYLKRFPNGQAAQDLEAVARSFM